LSGLGEKEGTPAKKRGKGGRKEIGAELLKQTHWESRKVEEVFVVKKKKKGKKRTLKKTKSVSV